MNATEEKPQQINGLELEAMTVRATSIQNIAGTESKSVTGLTQADSLDVHGWHPIETAPKDGRALLVSQSGNVFIGAWRSWYSQGLRGEMTCWWSQGAMHAYQPHDMRLNPTHWMPLPAAPDVT